MAQVYAQPVARKTMIVHPVAPPVTTQRVARQRIAQPVARGEALQPVARYLQPHAPLSAASGAVSSAQPVARSDQLAPRARTM